MVGQGSIPTLRGPTAEDFQGSAKASDLMAQNILGDYSMPETATSEEFTPDMLRVTPSEQPAAAEKPEKPTPPPIDTENIDRYGAAELAAQGKQLQEQMLSFLQNPNVSETEKNDAALEMAGYKDPQEGMNLEERAKANAAMYKRMFGEDPEGDKKIDGYNLAMLGFLIASGDSPSALQNIARGAAQGTKMFMDTAKERRAREDMFKKAGIDKAIRDDETRKKVAIDNARTLQGYRFQMFSDKIKSTENREILALKLNADASQLEQRLNTQLQIAADSNASAEKRAEAQNDASLLKAQIDALDVVGAMAFSRSGDDADQFGAEVQKILNNPEDLAQAAQISAMSKSTKGLLQGSTPERLRQDITDRIATMDAGKQIYFDAQGNLNEAGRNLYRNMLTMSQSGPGSAAPQYPTVTTQQEYDNLAPGAYFIQNGQTRQKPAQ
jgi:hypothetical protein